MKRAVIAILLLSFSVFSQAATSSTAKSKKAVSSKAKKTSKSVVNKEYQTSLAFDGTNIKGKVQEGNMRRIVIENDKSLDDLLGIRKNFADREKEETERNLSW